jgi:hypothetical protein
LRHFKRSYHQEIAVGLRVTGARAPKGGAGGVDTDQTKKSDLIDSKNAGLRPIRRHPGRTEVPMNEPMADISRHVWETKCRYPRERMITDSWRRIARALAAVEPNDPDGWEAWYFSILQDFKFLPGGRSHIAMQAARQPFVDNSVSKTINVPSNYPFREFKQIYDLAYDHGLRGCTTFRPNSITGTVLSEGAAGVEAPHCCVLEREAD